MELPDEAQYLVKNRNLKVPTVITDGWGFFGVDHTSCEHCIFVNVAKGGVNEHTQLKTVPLSTLMELNQDPTKRPREWGPSTYRGLSFGRKKSAKKGKKSARKGKKSARK